MKVRSIGLTSIPFLLVGLLVAVSFPQGAHAAAGLARSGRWLTYNRQHPYFVGFDTQQLVADPTLNYVSQLDTFQKYHINKLRIWLICPWLSKAKRSSYLYPWALSGNKYNLDKWNPRFWHRLNGVLAAAKSRNILVEISLFPANYVDSHRDFAGRSVWNKANNVNGAFTANAQGTFDPEFFNLNLPEKSNSGKTLKQYQEALVDKAVDDVNRGGFDNVYFEICNEIPGTSRIPMSDAAAWQNFFADRVNTETSRLVGVHAQDWALAQTKGIQYFWNQPAIDILTFHFGIYDPHRIDDLLHSAQTHGKVLQTNEGNHGRDWTHPNRIAEAAWAFFISGGYFAAYQGNTHTTGDKDWVNIAVRLEALRNIAESVSFWKMSPVDSSGKEYDSLVTQGPTGSNWQVLANVGNQYVVYFWGTAGTSSVVINLPAGTYNYKFYDVRKPDTIITQGNIASTGGKTTIASPTTGWKAAAGLALTITRQASH